MLVNLVIESNDEWWGWMIKLTLILENLWMKSGLQDKIPQSRASWGMSNISGNIWRGFSFSLSRSLEMNENIRLRTLKCNCLRQWSLSRDELFLTCRKYQLKGFGCDICQVLEAGVMGAGACWAQLRRPLRLPYSQIPRTIPSLHTLTLVSCSKTFKSFITQNSEWSLRNGKEISMDLDIS